jgi:outer membrane protein OmpA-like peptidoglycan-associated protein
MGQSGALSVTNKSAIKNYEKATTYYDNYKNDEAVKELDKAIQKAPDFIEAYILKANIFVDKNELENAVEQYRIALKINPTFYPNSYFILGTIEMGLGRYDDARSNYKIFISMTGVNPDLKAKAKHKLSNCEFALHAINNPVPFNPENLGANINTLYDEYFPSITVDDSTLIFTRNRPLPQNPAWLHEDFYVSRRTGDSWSKAVNAGSRLNTSGNEGVPNLSPDGKLLFFAACERPDGQGSCDIYYSRWRQGNWTKPINLGYPVNTGAWESQPSFSSDGRTLYFIRGRFTGEGIKEQDIYRAVVSVDGWSTPEKLTSKINTPGEEEFVFIHPDDQTLYFSSDGHPGMGNLDIYFSRKDKNDNWTTPVNMGYPVNTYKDERGMLVGPKGEVAYIASNRVGGMGGLDLYKFDLPESARPKQLSYVKGVVADAETGEPLFAEYEIIDLTTGKTFISSATDKYNGEFIACLTAGKNYALNVSKEGYLFYSDHFSCDNPSDLKSAYSINVKLQKAKEGGKVVLRNVFFDTNLYNLKEESFPELNKLVLFLRKNPTARIEISGHTDSTGDKTSNQELSKNRAKAVYDYLIEQGLDTARLEFKGFGDTVPIADNNTVDGRALNRRTEFRILSL